MRVIYCVCDGNGFPQKSCDGQMVFVTNEEAMSFIRSGHAIVKRFVEMTDDDIKLLGDAKRLMLTTAESSLLSEVDTMLKRQTDKAYADGLKTGEVIGIEKQKTVQLADHAEQMAREFERGQTDIRNKVEAILKRYSQCYAEMKEIRDAMYRV